MSDEGQRHPIEKVLRHPVVAGLIVAAVVGTIKLWWPTSNQHPSSTPTAAVVTPKNPKSSSATSSTTDTTSSTTTTQPPPPQVVWQHEFTFAYNASYGFDSFPPSKTESVNGFGVERNYNGPGIAFTTVGATDAVQWTGKGQPAFAQCQDALASGGTGSIVIGASGLSAGGWICGETDTGLIARFRYDSGTEASSYTFFVTVWKPGQQ
jgi:hypothetical protein